jgi:hypothetical protein
MQLPNELDRAICMQNNVLVAYMLSLLDRHKIDIPGHVVDELFYSIGHFELSEDGQFFTRQIASCTPANLVNAREHKNEDKSNNQSNNNRKNKDDDDNESRYQSYPNEPKIDINRVLNSQNLPQNVYELSQKAGKVYLVKQDKKLDHKTGNVIQDVFSPVQMSPSSQIASEKTVVDNIEHHDNNNDEKKNSHLQTQESFFI